MSTRNPGLSSPEEQFERLVRFVTSHSSNEKSETERRQEIKVRLSLDVPAGRGLVYTEDVQPDQLLLSLPSDCLLNARTLGRFLHPRLIPTKTSPSRSKPGSYPLSSTQSLSLILCRWRSSWKSRRGDLADSIDAKDGKSFDHFGQTLPESFPTVPLVWQVVIEDDEVGEGGDGVSDDAPAMRLGKDFLRALLESLPRDEKKLLSEVKKRFDRDWECVDHLQRHDPDLLNYGSSAAGERDDGDHGKPDDETGIATPTSSSRGRGGGGKERITKKSFLWSWLCVNSRCVFLQMDLPNHSDNFTMAPLLDMANHTSQPSLECKVRYTSKGGLELYAPPASSRQIDRLGRKGLCKGDEVFITYGPHSNSALLSEYGFLLPAICPEDDDLGRSPEELSAKEWRGNRYSQVNVDEVVTKLFQEQGQEGETKLELLSDKGYRGDWTIHPLPSPAHPSHRLVTALRLLSIDLGKSQGSSRLRSYEAQSSLHHADKRRRKKESDSDWRSKLEEGDGHGRRKGGGGSINGKEMEKVGRGSDELEAWESTLLGTRDKVSESNEVRSRDWLSFICSSVLEELDKCRTKLDEARNRLEASGEGRKEEEEEQGKACVEVVERLIQEGIEIARLVDRANSSQDVEW
ncbi:hypothetical protein IE53DRAFT_385542 [Violaceomyces palustris]|uniref:Uncharacterized protein n=1 Tax=Violaceomyces palustris TaxID=1673888 RepID=A0ACD0P1W0_9BASI|nr:hypothetical protein IE53DRAFT_385542 [Violaceomyces palustris]